MYDIKFSDSIIPINSIEHDVQSFTQFTTHLLTMPFPNQAPIEPLGGPPKLNTAIEKRKNAPNMFQKIRDPYDLISCRRLQARVGRNSAKTTSSLALLHNGK